MLEWRIGLVGPPCVCLDMYVVVRELNPDFIYMNYCIECLWENLGWITQLDSLETSGHLIHLKYLLIVRNIYSRSLMKMLFCPAISLKSSSLDQDV